MDQSQMTMTGDDSRVIAGGCDVSKRHFKAAAVTSFWSGCRLDQALPGWLSDSVALLQ
jgi:hypothetical protein